MRNAYFLNLTQHALTEEQVQEALKLTDKIVGLEVLPADIIEKLKQSPKNDKELVELSDRVIGAIYNFIVENGIKKLYIHLPIGSPAFMFVLSNDITELAEDMSMQGKCDIKIVFSHSKRLVKVENGQKITRFKFEGFIIFGEEVE